MVWVEFSVCVATVIYFGTRLTRSADALAEKSNLGRNWVGFILLATVTSLPELATGVSAAAISKLPDIALGEALGSCTFNLLILALLDLAYRKKPLLTGSVESHTSSGVFGILLLLTAGAFLLLRGIISELGPLWFGAYSPIILVLYFLAVRQSYTEEGRRALTSPPRSEEKYALISKRRIHADLCISSAVIIACGIWLPDIGDRISEQTGLGHTFVGALLIAWTTSMPELVVSLEAIRIRAIDLSIANLLGSNLFNLAVVAIEDLSFVDGSILSAGSTANLIPIASSIIMTGAVLLHMSMKPPDQSAGFFKRKSLALSILLLYAANAALMFHYRG